MLTGVVLEFAGVAVATNSLKICMSASLEACANAAAFTQAILVAGDGGTVVSLFWGPEQNATRYPINQQIIAGEPAVS